MDFFDPKKQKQHAIRIGVGYAVIALGLVLATTILLYQSSGFGIDKNGTVYQNGLLFVSSVPDKASIYLNGHLYNNQTNNRVILPAGQYTMQIHRDGYLDWQRAVSVDGGTVERFDYPILVPAKLEGAAVKKYNDTPSVSTQSLDRRWLLVGAGASNDFDLYDLSAPKPVAKPVAISPDILSAGTTTGWTVVGWADDDRHVLLRRAYQKDVGTGSEYVLVDRQDAGQSQNLTTLLGFNPTTIAFRDGNYDQYLAFDQAAGTLFTAALKKPTPQLYLEHVLNVATDKNAVLYATSLDAPAGKVLIRLKQGDDPAYTVRSVAAGSTYVLDIASYNGTPFIAAGAQSENKVYVYKDALAQLKGAPGVPLAPVQILKVTTPTYAAFSDTARYVMAENNDYFSVYDLENDKGYNYQVKTPLDAPQAHATWLDGYHLDLVSAGKVQMFDYDGANPFTLSAAAPAYAPAFRPDYKVLYTLTAQNALLATPLRTPRDQ
ncbi:MAG TPA: PEGA domain-containing protein [Candidatus Saccharimonadales bacterium]|nr:PEGA domain-containing protein [Candidatus Saccharimonadales bacterium]